MSDASDHRYEIKMVCEEEARADLLSALRLMSAGIQPLYGERCVQSIYFDTHEGDALEDNLAGISDRRKLRFRWYGEASRSVRGQLELKVRRNKLGTKEVLPLDVAIAVEGAHRMAFASAIRELCPPAWRERLHRHEPVQWIRYSREYWTTGDRAIRLTIDRDLRSFDLRGVGRIARVMPNPPPGLLVVELKAPEHERERLEELVQEVPLVVDKCSKFVLAAASEHGPIVSRYLW